MASENSLTSVLNEKEKSFEENCDDTNIKFDFDELDTKNLELEHVVASLQKENEHLKQTYKNLFDSIKRSRVQNQTSNKSDSQITPNHLFAKENFMLQKKIVELEKTIAQQTKDFGDAKNDFSIETDKYEKYFAHLETQNASLQEKLASSDHPSLHKEYNDLRTSYNALKAKFDVLNRSKGKSQVSNESKPQVSVSEKDYTGDSSKPFSKKVSLFTTYSLQKGRKFSKRPNFF
jgi:predicted  nucleic acid-binding Zn-ribbon protein